MTDKPSEPTREAIKVTLTREIIETDYSGEHSIRTTEIVAAELKFLTSDGKEPRPRNPQFCCIGEWKVLK